MSGLTAGGGLTAALGGIVLNLGIIPVTGWRLRTCHDLGRGSFAGDRAGMAAVISSEAALVADTVIRIAAIAGRFAHVAVWQRMTGAGGTLCQNGPSPPNQPCHRQENPNRVSHFTLPACTKNALGRTKYPA